MQKGNTSYQELQVLTKRVLDHTSAEETVCRTLNLTQPQTHIGSDNNNNESTTTEQIRFESHATFELPFFFFGNRSFHFFLWKPEMTFNTRANRRPTLKFMQLKYGVLKSW